MAKVIGKLSAISLGRLPAGYHGDGAGLWLQVTTAGARSWVMRYTLNGKRREMGLGPTHTVGLSQAREAAKNARLLLREGIDPIEARKGARVSQELAKARALTFAQCCEAYIDAHQSGWKNQKHIGQWRSTLETYCKKINDFPVADVGQGEVLGCLEPIWRDKSETASRLRGRIESVLDWATVRGYRAGDNPARWKGHLDHLLPTISKARRVKHHRALPWQEIAPFMTALRKEEGISARALEFLILTAARSGEVRGATWDEIDFNAKLWIVPPERMKMGREHRVPLTPQTLTLLNALPRLRNCKLLFPSGNTNKPLSDMALTALLRRMEVDAVPHGFRSTFRDWAGESTAHPREVCEHALAHKLADGVEAAYQRGDMLTKRVAMMNDWATFCDSDKTTQRKSMADIFLTMPDKRSNTR